MANVGHRRTKCKGVEVRVLDAPSGPMVITHLLVNCGDSMARTPPIICQTSPVAASSWQTSPPCALLARRSCVQRLLQQLLLSYTRARARVSVLLCSFFTCRVPTW